MLEEVLGGGIVQRSAGFRGPGRPDWTGAGVGAAEGAGRADGWNAGAGGGPPAEGMGLGAGRGDGAALGAGANWIGAGAGAAEAGRLWMALGGSVTAGAGAGRKASWREIPGADGGAEGAVGVAGVEDGVC